MKGYMILGSLSLLAVLATPVQAQQKGTTVINGNVFDAPQGYQAGPPPGAISSKRARRLRSSGYYYYGAPSAQYGGTGSYGAYFGQPVGGGGGQGYAGGGYLGPPGYYRR
jgi:hypothetical protein